MLVEKPYQTHSYGGGYGRIGPPPRRQKAGTGCIQSMISVFIIAVFIVIVMPMWIIPQLGISMESYENNKMLWSFVAGLIATPFAWLGAKALTSLIRSD
jgi:hypothetical protein